MKNTRLKQLYDFLEKQPGDPFLKYAIATEHLKLDEQEKALEGFRELRREHPGYLGTYYHLGKLLEQMGQEAAAEEVYLKGMEVARSQGNRHALSELQAAFASLAGDEDEDE